VLTEAASILPVRIAGTGHALPAQLILSETLDRRLGFPAGRIKKLSGVSSRFVTAEESQIDMAVSACKAALEKACQMPKDIDLVLGACGIPYQTLPATAPLVMQRLGFADGAAAAYDVNATCLSFLSAFELAANKLALGQAKSALVFSADIASRALPWEEQPDVAALFGDGAAAAVLTAAEENGPGMAASLLRTYPSAYAACEIGAGGTRFDFHKDREAFARHAVFHMEGKDLFRVTRKHFPQFVEDLLSKAGWDRQDIDIVVPHQASPLALEHMIRETGMERSRVVDISRTHGNQIAASLPTALDIAWRQGRIEPGMRVLLLGTSAGVTFGGMALEV
jgi:3-oxoacyl-[acyl-carrier-protein] synthase-3